MSEQTIIFAGGGTGGHLYPGIAVAQELRELVPEARCVFLCTEREIDRTILQPTGLEFIAQPIIPPARSIGGLLRFWKSWRQTHELVRGILRDRAPVAALGLGGYAAGVAIKLAAKHRIPAAILNPDVIPGKANKYLMQYVQTVCCQFDATAQHTPPAHRHKLVTTGCPIRGEIRQLPARNEAAARLGLDPLLSTLLITGASLGAKTVNEAVVETLAGVKLQGWQVLHLAGKDHVDAVRAGYRAIELPARVIDFTPAMADVWAVTTLAVCRAGASTCAELTACGLPSILFPYPFHKDKHQLANAQALADAGAAVVLEDLRDAKKNASQLRPILTALLYDGSRRQTMAGAAQALGKPDAAHRAASVVRQLVDVATSEKSATSSA